MSVDYRLTVKCQDCYAVTTYTNERPDWQTWEPDPETVAQARAWLAEHPDERPVLLSMMPGNRPHPPAYVSIGGIPLTYHLSVPDSYRYVTCPACDGEALPYDGAADDSDTEQAVS